MESGGFGESDIMAVSGYTKRILSLTKVQVLSLLFSDTNKTSLACQWPKQILLVALRFKDYVATIASRVVAASRGDLLDQFENI